MPDLVDTRTVALALGVSEAWVRSHAGELGGTRLPASNRLRFDRDRIAAVLAERAVPVTVAPVRRAPMPPQRRRPGPRRGQTEDSSEWLLQIPPKRRRT